MSSALKSINCLADQAGRYGAVGSQAATQRNIARGQSATLLAQQNPRGDARFAPRDIVTRLAPFSHWYSIPLPLFPVKRKAAVLSRFCSFESAAGMG
jgi:hypothetical protein